MVFGWWKDEDGREEMGDKSRKEGGGGEGTGWCSFMKTHYRGRFSMIGCRGLSKQDNMRMNEMTKKVQNRKGGGGGFRSDLRMKGREAEKTLHIYWLGHLKTSGRVASEIRDL